MLKSNSSEFPSTISFTSFIPISTTEASRSEIITDNQALSNKSSRRMQYTHPARLHYQSHRPPSPPLHCFPQSLPVVLPPIHHFGPATILESAMSVRFCSD